MHPTQFQTRHPIWLVFWASPGVIRRSEPGVTPKHHQVWSRKKSFLFQALPDLPSLPFLANLSLFLHPTSPQLLHVIATSSASAFIQVDYLHWLSLFALFLGTFVRKVSIAPLTLYCCSFSSHCAFSSLDRIPGTITDGFHLQIPSLSSFLFT